MEGPKAIVHQKHAWILADADKVGSQNQCIGLAERLGYSYNLKKIKLNLFYKLMAPFFYFGSRYFAGVDLKPPYPDVIIASGRQAASVTASLNKKAKTIFLLDPYLPSFFFDAVVVPFHDERMGRSRRASNVIKTLGALHGLTCEKLEAAAKAIPFPKDKPNIVVLLGGDSRHFTYTQSHIKEMAKKLKKLATFMGGAHLLITPSRRTRPELIDVLKTELASMNAYIWDFQGDNPYFSMLGHADVIIATSDSISMTSEACSVCVPVFVEDLAINNRKFRHYFKTLLANGYAFAFCENNFSKVNEKAVVLDEFQKVEKALKDKKIIA